MHDLSIKYLIFDKNDVFCNKTDFKMVKYLTYIAYLYYNNYFSHDQMLDRINHSASMFLNSIRVYYNSNLDNRIGLFYYFRKKSSIEINFNSKLPIVKCRDTDILTYIEDIFINTDDKKLATTVPLEALIYVCKLYTFNKSKKGFRKWFNTQILSVLRLENIDLTLALKYNSYNIPRLIRKNHEQKL